MKRHFIIPDTQVSPGHPIDHMTWIGLAIEEYRPDVVIHLGDHWDMASLSAWSQAGSADKEGKRYRADIDAGNDALWELEKAISGYSATGKGFKPKRKVILRGNHEQRIERVTSADPRLLGAIGYHDFNDRELGWEVVDYFHGSPKAVSIDGILYAHYFANPNTGKAIAGTINNRLSKIGGSFVQGHQQGLFQGNVQYATGLIRHGIVAGSCYLHDEGYKGMANSHWRGVVVLNEVKAGTFCEMPLTLDYLCRKYEGTNLRRYLRKKYRRAADRFTVAA